MISHDLDIHIEWDGPFTLKEVRESKTLIDYGLYQVYGHHPIYGSDVLLYIGQAAKQTFSKRVAEEARWHDNRDAGRLKFYLGRLRGRRTPRRADWRRQIDLAERLLIMTLSPANNTQKSIGSLDTDLHQIHVFNYGHHRDLLPEVSGARWSSRLGEMADYIDYGSNRQNRNRKP